MNEPAQMPQNQGPVVYAAAPRTRNNAHRLAGPILLLICLAISLFTVVVVPMVVSGTEPASSRSTKASPQSAASAGVSYQTLEQAAADLGFAPVAPATLPKDMYYTAIQVLDGKVLQMTIVHSGQQFIYRTAQGNEDLSGDDTEYGYTLTEEVDGVTRSYAGSDENTLNLAVWAQGGSSFAVVAQNGADAGLVKALAESVR